MDNILKRLKNIKDEAYSLIGEIDKKIDNTNLSIELSVKDIKEILRLMESGFRYDYKYDYYLRDRGEIFKKLEDLIN